MPNTNNALPSSGPISLQDIADAFYLYRSYADGNTVAIDNYYGDLIKYYSPTAPGIPTSITKRINVDAFHGKRYGLPIPLVISSAVNNYNVYDYANAYAQSTYGLPLNTPGVPFFITVTNNSTVGAASVTGPIVNTGTASFTTPGTYTWTVPAGITSVNVVIVGGGGGGGTGGTYSLRTNGGGGGGGAQVTALNGVAVPSGTVQIVVGSGGSTGSTGGTSTFLSSTLSAAGGIGGSDGSYSSGGAGGGSGGAGGGGGGNGNITSGGSGGRTLAAPYGVGGSGGFPPLNTGTGGANGAVLITYGIIGGNTSNTLSVAAMSVGTSSDGSKIFNQYTSIEIINNGTIAGCPDATPYRNFTGNGSFLVNEGETTVGYYLAGGGGGGGGAGAADKHQPTGGQGGDGGSASGNIGVNPGDVVSWNTGGGGYGGGYTSSGSNGDSSNLSLNGQLVASAPGGGGGFYGGGNAGSYGGGGGGGYGGPHSDGRPAGYAGGNGGSGAALVSYQPNLPGGPALYLTAPTSIVNNGVVAGGSSSAGVIGSGYAVIGRDRIVGTLGGTVYGSLV